MTSRLCAALDKCKVSDRDAVHLLTACIESLSLNPASYIINRTSIRNSRESIRKEIAEKVHSDFVNLNVDFVIVHWDTKLLPGLTNQEKVDRLPVIVSTPNGEQLLGVPEIPSGTGSEISSAVYDCLEKWYLLDKVQGFVFDTTASNTGRLNGASTLLEQKLNRDIIYFACRHHVSELIIQAAFNEAKLYVSSGPIIPIFKRFQNAWKEIDKTKILVWNTNKNLKKIISPIRQEIVSFCFKKITEDHPRDDYKELIELVIIILGETPPGGTKIRQPGACHQARWMAKCIYCLKIFLLRTELKITKTEENAIVRISAFIVKNYIKYWFTVTNVSEAPFNDINLIRTLNEYKSDDKKIADACLSKFLNHLFYLNEECAVFAIFDERISYDVRKKMADKLLKYQKQIELTPGVEDEFLTGQKKLCLKLEDVDEFLNKELPVNLLSYKSYKIFKRFGISSEYLKIDPTKWNDNLAYQSAKRTIDSLQIVNDTAERGVKLMEDFNDKFSKNENQKQFLLQVGVKKLYL